MADHLSRLNEEAMLKLKDELDIDNTFLNQQVLAISHDFFPLFSNITNYLNVMWF